MAFEKLGQPDAAAKQHATVVALLHSIAGGHHGTGPDDAFNAVSIAEEYVMLDSLGWKSQGQALIPKDGHNFDALDVVAGKSGKAFTVYFNIDACFGHELGR